MVVLAHQCSNKCLDATRVSNFKASARPAGQQVDLFIRSLSLPYFNRIGCPGPCGMTLVFCSLRHYTGPHSVFSVGWHGWLLLRSTTAAPPLSLFPLHPACPPARLRTPALTDKVPSRNRTRGTTLWEDPSGPKNRDTGGDHALRAPGSDKAAWAMGLPLQYTY